MNRFFSRPLASLAGIAAVWMWMAGEASAGPLFGISVSAGAVANDGCAANGSYSTSGGGPAPTITNFGSGPSTEGFINCSPSFSGPSQAGLTGATLQAGANDTSRNDNNPHFGSATSTADLATGALHGYSSSGGNASFQGTGQGSTDAQFFDELTFNISGAADDTVTNIPVFFSVDGSGDDLTQQEWGALLHFGFQQFYANGENDVNWGWNLNEGSTLGPPAEPYFNSSSGGLSSAASINWMDPAANTIDNLMIEGDLTVTGPSATVDLMAELSTLANGGTVDFSDTAAISFQLPDGVTMNSASGVFDTASTPEPGSATLVGAGLALLALGRFRRRVSGKD